MVSREGVEPPACPLGGGRSIRLSYRDILPIFLRGIITVSAENVVLS